METETPPTEATDATTAQPKPPHEVEDFFKGWVLPKMDALEDEKHVSDFISVNQIWDVWAPHRYQEHSVPKGMATLGDLRKSMRPIKVSYNDSRLGLLGE